MHRGDALAARDLIAAVGRIPILSEVSLSVPPSGRHALVGPNGSGKTTLLNVITGLLRARGGRLALNGKDVTRIQAFRRARLGLGRTFQSPNLFHEFTVAECGALALRPGDKVGREIVVEATSVPADFHQNLERLGVADLLDVKAGSLSFGQRKLVALAVALVPVPSLLLLDEPVAGLSPIAQERVANLLATLPCALIVVEHNFNFLKRIGGETTVLSGGRVAFVGPTEDVLDSDELKRLYR